MDVTPCPHAHQTGGSGGRRPFRNVGLELITATTFVLELVVEVSTDHITDRHFRHGARILRWRTDKEPHDCTMDQIERR